MGDHISQSDSHVTSPYNAVFIDTSLGTHLATIVSSSETVADLKKKVLHEHALCFPHIRDLKIHALKVKRRGKFYYLSESMLVKSVFHGLNKTWFISVDASSSEAHYENRNFPTSNDENLLAPAGMRTVGLANLALPEKCGSPEKLVSVADKQLHNDEDLALIVPGGEGSGNMDIEVAITENNLGEAKSVDANDRSGSSMQKKGDYYDKEKEIQKSSSEGGNSSGRNEIRDEPVSIPSEERAAGTMSTIKKKKKSKRKSKHDVDDFNSKEGDASLPESGINRSQNETVAPEISLGNAHGIVSHDVSVENYNIIDWPRTILSSDANKATATIARWPTVLSEETGLLEKHAEAESKKNNVDVQQDQSAEEDSKLEPAAKRRRKSKQAKKGDEDLLKDDGTLVSEYNKAMLEDSTISQNSQVDEQKQRNATLHGSLVGAPESVHLQSVSPSGEKKRRRKKSAKTLNQETAAVPSSATDAELVSGHHAHDLINSEPDTVSLKEKHDEPIQEINLRPSSLEIDTSNKDVDNLEGVCEASGSAIASNSERKKVSKMICAIALENNPRLTVKTSDKTEKENEVSGHENMIHNVHQNHVPDQNDRVTEEQEFSINISAKSAPSGKCKTSAQDDVDSKTNEAVVASKFPEASEPVDPPRSSKKRKKSKKVKDLVSGTPSTSVTEHVEGYVSGTSPTEPHKAATGGLPGDTSNKEESNRPPKDGKEALQMDAMSNSLLATDKEINDVIQNVVDSVQQIGEDEVDTEIMHGKPRKKTRKKQLSDAKHLPESEKENEHVGKSYPALSIANTGELNYSFKLTKDATLANTDAINQSIGSIMECGKEIIVENDPGSRSVQVQPHNPESDSKKRFPVAVMNGDPSKSGLESRGADDMEVSCESNRVNFNIYFATSKHDLETVGPGEMLVDGSNKTKGADDGMKAKKKKKKKKKLNAHSDGPLPEMRTPKNLNDSIGAKPQTGNSSTAEVRDSFKNAESEDIALQPNKEPLEVPNTGVKALPSSKSHKFNSVPEEPRLSTDVKPTEISAHAKNKKTESSSGLESSKNSIFLKRRVDGHQSLEDHNPIDGRKASTINTGVVVNSSQKGKSLIGVSSSIFNDVIDGAYSGEDGDSDASTRTPSDGSLSSDYSDGGSNPDSNLTQNGSCNLRRKEVGEKTVTKPLSSGMSLDVILRSSSRYKKAKLTASQSQLEDTESQPVDFVPDSQPNP